jgi:diguanylate cyclase
VRRTPIAGWLPRPAARAAVRAGLALAGAALLVDVAATAADPDLGVGGAARVATAALAAGLCLLRAALVATDRAAWSLLGGGILAWAAGEAVWVPAPAAADAAPPSPADAGYLLFPVLALAAVALLLRGRSARPVPRWLLADGLVWVLAAGSVAAALVGPRLHAVSGGDAVGVLVALAYPVLDVALVGLLLVAVAATGFHEASWWALAAGIALFVAADAAWLLRATEGSYQVGGLPGIAWTGGLLLLAVAAWQRPVPVRQLRLRPWTVLAVPVLAVTVSLAVLASTAWVRPQPAAVQLAVAAVALAAGRATLALRRSYATEAAGEAVTDELTGLANRRLLLARLDDALAGGKPHALVLLDLDRFKEVNDTLGHPVGDELLRRLGPRLAGTARPGETVARLGGDEFAVLLPGMAGEAEALRAAHRVLAGLVGAFVIDGLTLFMTASAGVALASAHGTDSATLLRCADVAMYQAKRSGAGAAVYRPRADPHSRSRLGAATDLKQAIADGAIVCLYQPQVDVATGVPVGMETLARLADPRRGLVPPEEFLDLAEQTGLMPALADLVLRSALAEARRWRADVRHLRVAVNLAASSLLDSGLPDRIAAALRAADLPADALALEISESALTDTGRARDTLDRLHAMGVAVCLDGYGTGRSSVVLLMELPVDQIKLDGGLVAAVRADQRARAIVRHTVLMAHALDIQVVAKGVEDPTTLGLVDELGCDHMQGYQIAPPMPAGEVAGWLSARRSGTAAAGGAARPA